MCDDVWWVMCDVWLIIYDDGRLYTIDCVRCSADDRVLMTDGGFVYNTLCWMIGC